MEFTKDELYEIEKRFDIYAGETVRAMAMVINQLGKFAESKSVKKLFNEHMEAFNIYREISAKAKSLRDKLEMK